MGVRVLRDSFWDTLELGTTIHWHNAFGAYVRGVVADVEVDDGKIARGMIPVALVGNWRDFELPRWYDDGRYSDGGTYVGKIRNGEPMRPNQDSIWESDCMNRSGRPDPTGMDEIDLTPPEPTPEQEAAASFRDVLLEIASMAAMQEVPANRDWVGDYQQRILAIRERVDEAMETLEFDRVGRTLENR
mgnify:FL=1